MSAIASLDAHRDLKWKREENIPGGGIVYVTRKYDDAFSAGLLNEIKTLYENGWEPEDLSEKFNRPFMEILYALLYLADQEQITRPFAYRRKE